MPSSIQPKVALLSILSCDAAKGVLKLNPRQDEKVLITGMGVIGLLACNFLKYYVGIEHVDVVEPNKIEEILQRSLVRKTYMIQKKNNRNI